MFCSVNWMLSISDICSHLLSVRKPPTIVMGEPNCSCSTNSLTVINSHFSQESWFSPQLIKLHWLWFPDAEDRLSFQKHLELIISQSGRWILNTQLCCLARWIGWHVANIEREKLLLDLTAVSSCFLGHMVTIKNISVTHILLPISLILYFPI